jgi:hypothetical protein
MIKSLILASAVCLAMATSASAGSRCDEPQRASIEAKIKALPDGEQKTAAMTEWELSTKAFNEKNLNDCDTHMNNATKAGGIDNGGNG